MAKIIQTPQQRANTLDALNVMWPSVPPDNVYPGLAWWRGDLAPHETPACGTVACFGGWCAWWPAFRAQGIEANREGMPRQEGGWFAGDASFQLFGVEDMFYSRGSIEADAKFTGTDHELVTNRLKWLLANSEASA